MIIIKQTINRPRISKPKIERLASFVLDYKNKKDSSISFSFVGNSFILKLNKKYFSKNCPTDVISFPLADTKDPFNFLGEIIISLEEVNKNAKKYKNSFVLELYLCVIHGILHLFGYKDKPKKEYNKMIKEQELILAKAVKSKIV